MMIFLGKNYGHDKEGVGVRTVRLLPLLTNQNTSSEACDLSATHFLLCKMK